MGVESQYLSIGRMAALHHINKKTLMFYDEIDLFSPVHIGENGYRYYSYSQSMILEKILFLRRLGVSLDDIRHHIKEAGAKETLRFFSQEREKNRAHIEELLSYDRILSHKEEELRQALSAEPFVVREENIPAKKYILSHVEDKESAVAGFFSKLLAAVGERLYYYTIGSILELEDLEQGFYHKHSHHFIAFQEGMGDVNSITRPSGRYLALYWKGPWNSIPQGCEQLKEYADLHGLELCGAVYEENLIDHFFTVDEKEFLTKITVPVREK